MDTEVMENPTPDEGASIQDRLERLLAAEDGEPEQQQATEQSEAAEETESEPEGDAHEESEEQLTTADLAKYLGIDEDLLDSDEDGNLLIKTKVDGQEGKAKFQDFLKSYQLQNSIDNRSREVAEQQKALQSAIAEQQQAITQRMQYAEDMANVANLALMNEYNGINWDELAQNDPAEFVAKQHQFQQRQGQLNQVMQAMQMERMQQQQLQQQGLQQRYAESAEQLKSEFHEWSGEKATETGKYISGYSKYGISQQDLADLSRGVYGAAPLMWAHKAMLYDLSQKSKAAIENKVRTAPKLVKAGQPDTTSRTEKTMRDLKTTIRKSGGKDGIREYLLATGKA